MVCLLLGIECSAFRELFDEILTSEDFSRSKPDPDCYLKAAARLGAESDECVVFEDSFNGLKSGRAAGMAVVGLATTNSAESIAPYSDIQMADYTEVDTASLLRSLSDPQDKSLTSHLSPLTSKL